MNPLHKRMLTGLLAINVVGLICATIAQDFSKRPFDYAKAYYRIVRGTDIEVAGRKITVPAECFKSHMAAMGVTHAMTCRDGPRPWLSIDIRMFSSEIVRGISENTDPHIPIRLGPDEIYFSVHDDERDVRMHFHIRPSDGLAVTGDIEDLTRALFKQVTAAVPDPLPARSDPAEHR